MPPRPSERWLARVLAVATVAALANSAADAQPTDPAIARWLVPQDWQRNADGPILSLGAGGAFDNQHIFAPAVIREGNSFLLWYCGSRGTVEDRVFCLGLANSKDGRAFERHPDNPVLRFADGRHSVLTPTILTDTSGKPIREGGKLRIWLSSTDFHDATGLHTLHESFSDDGIHWSPPSPALLNGVCAPTVLKDGEHYRMWYTDVSKSPWIIRYAESSDGKQWQAEPTPALAVDQSWELSRLFYPTVRQVDGLLLMWYGSYWKGQDSQKTALGFAVSRDGLHWTKSSHNPVFRPDPDRTWESHYVTSQSLVRLDDGSWRIWYASRTKPPFVHKYFAINTARWAGPKSP